MTWLPLPFGVLAGLCWLSALVHWILSLGHLSGRVSLGAMLFQGYQAFNSENFTDKGKLYQRRFAYSAGGFALALFLTVGAGLLAAQLSK